MLRRARVIDEAEIVTDVVSLGSKVVLKDLEEGSNLEFIVVGTAEADPGLEKFRLNHRSVGPF